ncbi:YmfQ family protein, partial [Enterobacter asburiae]
RYYWQVNMPVSTQLTPMTAISNCTDSLRTWGDTVAECVLEKLAPSHTYVIFRYPE